MSFFECSGNAELQRNSEVIQYVNTNVYNIMITEIIISDDVPSATNTMQSINLITEIETKDMVWPIKSQLEGLLDSMRLRSHQLF